MVFNTSAPMKESLLVYSCCLDRSVATCLSFALLVAEQLDNATISAHTPLITAIPPAPPATPAPTLADDVHPGKPHSTPTLSLIKNHLSLVTRSKIITRTIDRIKSFTRSRFFVPLTFTYQYQYSIFRVST